VDTDAAQAAGIRDAERRRSLLEYLESRGFSLDDMVEAEAQGRLFALAGDAIIRSGRARYSLRSAAALLDVPVDDVAHAWFALGLTATDVDQVALSDADVTALRTWADMGSLLGSDIAFGMLRVLGASMARVAESESTAIRAAAPDIQLGFTADELRTARAFAAMAELVPRVAQLMDAVHRQHLQSARDYFEAVLQDASPTVLCGVGFADLSGFTSLSQRVSLVELSGLLSTFATTVSDVVHEHGGRPVKLIGDAVMWVNADPRKLAEVAAHLVTHPLAAKAGIQVRAGLAFGALLAMDGDYFGPAVNLAARLVALAEPGQVLASADLREQLSDWPSSALDPVLLRGFDAPVVPYALSGSRGPGAV
jgi:class 3 adenylate cyclase